MSELAKTEDSAIIEAHGGHDEHAAAAHHEPSVVPDPNWGWVGESPKTFRIAGVIIAVFLLFLLHGNHTGHVEDAYLLGIAVFILLIIFKDWALNRMSMRK